MSIDPKQVRARIATNGAFGSSAPLPSVERIHHSDELLLGPTAAISDFILTGNIDDREIIIAMLSEQREAIDKIDFTRVDEVSNKRFLDVTRRLWKMTKDTGITWTEILYVMGLQKKDKKAVPVPRV